MWEGTEGWSKSLPAASYPGVGAQMVIDEDLSSGQEVDEAGLLVGAGADHRAGAGTGAGAGASAAERGTNGSSAAGADVGREVGPMYSLSHTRPRCT